MIRESQSLKDTQKYFIKDNTFFPAPIIMSFRDNLAYYIKVQKLITALYMVTDIMDINEPLRNKLRTLGLEIISDIISFSRLNLDRKVQEVLSFLGIASSISIISRMNSSILVKEFSEFGQMLKKEINKIENQDRKIDLREFLREEEPTKSPIKDKYKSKGHKYPIRIGVQKASTLMKSLSDRTLLLSDRNNSLQNKGSTRKERRDSLLDIRVKINSKAQDGLIYGEKTIQRELLSMMKDGMLNKTGAKRWSRYFVKNT